MQDFDKSGQIKRYLEDIASTIECYENGTRPIYFDYDGVIGLLKQVKMLVTESARCPRPADLPPDMPWSEKLYNCDNEFDPYVFDGTCDL